MADNKVYIDIVVDDNGTTKKMAVDSKNLSKALDNTGKSAGTLDRNIKGVAGASANATKNNAKMMQGMGGLVGAYASFAAQIFAVTAAFNFLKSAGDLKVLQAGQVAYASATGIALKSLANNIIEATDAQISFQDASQAAAIGTAAGLSTQQLTDLGQAAKDVSIILGRDVTDSFNRLVRGVTKAEPELLDELGIVLRLKDATEKYAATLGKSADDLTTFERSQAVANDVLEQTQNKYSRILAVTGGSANIYSQLGKSFDDIIIKVKEAVDIIAGPFAKVLKDTPSLAIASLGLLISGPLKALGINFGDLSKAAKLSAEEAQEYYEKVSLQAKRATLDQEALSAKFKEVTASAAAANPASKVLERASQLGVNMSRTDKANLDKALKAAEKSYAKHGSIVKGIFKGMSIQMARDIALAFEEMNLAEDKKLSKTTIYATKAQALYAGVTASIKSMGSALLVAGTKLLSFLGYVGIAITVFQLVKDLLGKNETSLSVQEELYRKNRDSLAELNKELRTFAEVQKILAEGAKDYTVFGNLGAALGQRSTEQAKKDFELYKEAVKQETANLKAREAIAALQETQTYSAKEGYYIGGDKEALARANQAKENVRALTDDEKQAQNFFDTILTGLDNIEAESGMTLASFKEFRRVIETGGTAEEFEAARVKVAELTKTINEGARAAQDAASATTNFVNSFAQVNSAESAINNIQTRLDQINKLAADNPTYEVEVGETIRGPGGEPFDITYKVTRQGLAPELQKEREELKKNKKIIEEINTLQHSQKMDAIRLSTSQQMQLKGQVAQERAILNAKFAIQNTEKQISDATEKRNLLLTKIKDIQNKDLTPAQQRELENLNLLLEALGVKKDLQAEGVRLAELEAEAAEKRLKAVERENSLNVRRALSQRGTLFGKDIKAPSLLAEEQNRRFAAEAAQNEVLRLKAELETERKKEGSEYDAEAVAKLSGALSTAIVNARNLNAELDVGNRVLGEVTQTFETSLTSALDGLIQGTVSVKEAFAQMGISILRVLSRIIAEMIAVQILQSIIGGFGSVAAGSTAATNLSGGATGAGAVSNSIGFNFANPPARYGGVLSEGKKLPGYASGGIASGSSAGYPAILHGTEAVVPLPNNRSIPVDLKGAGQQNNVTVNVSVDSKGNAKQDTQANGQQGANLGNAIAAAVQKELQNQKRSGGILNPYGVA